MTPSQDMSDDGVIFVVAVLCIAAVLLFLAVRRTLIHWKEREVRRAAETLKTERDELERRANELEAYQIEMETLKTTLVDLAAEKQLLSRRGTKRTSASRRFIHEIGRAEPSRNLFRFTLSMTPGFAQRPGAKAVLHPTIWPFHNEAQVWSADFAAAQMLTRTVFNDSVGVTIAAQPEDADETDGGNEDRAGAQPGAVA